MEQDTDKLIEMQFKTLPQPVQRAISLTPWRKLTRGISIMHGLPEDKADSLETETMLIIYCFDSEENFAANIARELGIELDKAWPIARDIEDKVFTVILTKATEFAKKSADTLQSLPDVKPATQELAPKVVVESKPIVDDSSINRISPQAEADELKLEPPMMESSKTSLSPAAPVAVTSEPARGLISDKLKQVVTAPVETSKYPGGLDPYREPIN